MENKGNIEDDATFDLLPGNETRIKGQPPTNDEKGERGV